MMRYIFFSLIVIVTMSAFDLTASQPQKATIQIVPSTSGNDLKAWILEDNSLPMTVMRFTFTGAGSSSDPAGKYGLANIVSDMLLEGSGDMSANQFKEELTDLAIHMGFSVDHDNMYMSIKTLSKNNQRAIELALQAITQAKFSDKEIAKNKKRILAQLSQQKESPSYIASTKWKQLVYGDHPYSREVMGNSSDIATINAQDMRKFVHDNFTIKNLSISASGDIAPQEMEGYLNKIQLRHDYKPTKIKKAPFNQFDDIVHIEKDNPQSAILFGIPSVHYHDSDFYAVYILNHILGGGSFESMMMQEIRENNGLAYSAYSYLSNKKHAASLGGYIGTSNKNVDKAIKILREIISDILTKNITQKQLDDAKSYITGSFHLRMDSNSKLVNSISFMQTEDFGIDFLEKRNSYVEAVTLEKINDVAKKMLKNRLLSIVVVGGTVAQ